MPDFDKYWDTTEKGKEPEPAPGGHYAATVKGWEKKMTSGQGGKAVRPMARVMIALGEPEEDALEAGADAKALRGKVVSVPFFPDDERGLNDIEKFASETCGVDTEGLSVSEKLDATKGSAVRVLLQPPRDIPGGKRTEGNARVLSAD